MADPGPSGYGALPVPEVKGLTGIYRGIKTRVKPPLNSHFSRMDCSRRAENRSDAYFLPTHIYPSPPPYLALGRCARDIAEQARRPSLPQVPRYGVQNRIDPGVLPEEFRNLTVTEEMVISRAFPIAKVVRK